MSGVGVIERVTREFIVEWGETETAVLGGDETADDQELQVAVRKGIRKVEGFPESLEETAHRHGWLPGEPL